MGGTGTTTTTTTRLWKSIKAALGGENYNRGGLRNTTQVFVVSSGSRERTFFYLSPIRSSETLLGINKTWILPSTTIKSDSWGANVRLGDEEFTHHVVNHSVDLVDSYTGTHTSTVGATSKHVKVSLKGALYLLPGRGDVSGSMPCTQNQPLHHVHPHCQKCGLVSISSTPHCHT